METLKSWTLHQLQTTARDDLTTCQTQSERINATAIKCREIIDRAMEIQKTRKLGPGEETILEAARLGQI